MPRPPRMGTFSIVAADLNREEWGVAVQSKFISVGAVVPWAHSGVGALATQAYANVRYGPEGLKLLGEGLEATEVVRKLTTLDSGRDKRQLGVVDARGRASAFTGEKCDVHANHIVGDGFACQGNTLFSREVVPAMARAFESTPGDLPERLLAALDAGQREGGDRRGMQSAALLVVREKGGYDEGNDRWIDVRVDDHPSPIEELRRIFRLYDMTLLAREDPATLVPLTSEIVRVLQQQLRTLGFYAGHVNGEWDAATSDAFGKFLGENNFENKQRQDRSVWPSVLDYLDRKAKTEVDRRMRTHPVVPGALDRGAGGSQEARSSPPTGKG